MEEKITNIKKIQLSKFKKILLINAKTKNLLDKTAQMLSKENLIVIYTPDNDNDSNSLKTAKKLSQLCAIYESMFFIKNRLDIAKLSDSDGIILDKNGVDIDCTKKIIDSEKFFGLLYNNLANDSDECFNINSENKFDFLVNEFNIIELQ